MESSAAALQQVIAAWVQAIGSIIAIGIAIWVPMREARNVQRERKQDKADALRAIGTVMEIASRLVRNHVCEIGRRSPDDGLLRYNVNRQAFGRAILSLDAIELHSLPTASIVNAVANAAFDARRAEVLLIEVQDWINSLDVPRKTTLDELEVIAGRLEESLLTVMRCADLLDAGADTPVLR